MRKGFTLIEMSVVLVVIGLLVAGIILAQSLVRSSKVQTLITDASTYQTAISSFRQKYNAVPGDMANATTYWGTNPNCAAGTAGTGTQTCNGNGDGHITFNSSGSYEQFLVWQHLANAGFITGQYIGTVYPGVSSNAYYYCYPGANCPGGQVNALQAYYLIYSVNGFGGGSTTNYWDMPAGHYLAVGQSTPLNQGTTGWPGQPLLTAPEAQSLDSKVDDGLPGMGIWRSFSANGASGYGHNCVIMTATGAEPTSGTIASQSGAVYNTKYSNSNPACAFLIRLNF